MLRGIRKASANWLGKVVMAAVMGLLIVSFAIWGIGDIFRGFGRSSLAQIGRTEIGTEQFRQIYNDRLQQLGRRAGRPITPDQARAIGFDRQLLGQLIAEAALDERARQLRLGLSDAEIARRITEDPTFRGALGQFDRTRFEQLIRSAGYTEPRYVAEQRRALLRRQLVETIAGEMTPPNPMIEALNRYESEERAIEYVVLDQAKAGEIAAPTPEVLTKYFEDRKSLFRAPEYRKLVLLTVSPAEAARWITISDADARRAYEDQKARYATPERRQVQQIVFPSADEAKAAFDRIKSGAATFEGVAGERGLQPADMDLGLISKSDMLDASVADMAFRLRKDEIGQPIQGRFGTALIRVTKIEPGHERGFDEVATEIRRALALERGRAEMMSLHDKVEDEIAAGQQLSEAAQKLGLTATIIDAVDRSGRDPDGNAVRELPPGVDVLGGAFSSDVGVENPSIQLPGGGYLWYEVVEIKPSRERSLDEVKDKIETRWRDEQISERLKTKAAEMIDRLRSGTPLSEIAGKEGLKLETASALKRGQSSEALPAAVIEQVFRTPANGTNSAEGQNARERVVFRITGITAKNLDPGSDQAKRLEETLRRSYAEDLVGQYVAQLQNELGVTVNQSALRQVVGGEAN
jgi:peptidyl-prolyl cis-trans isomerase D